MFPVASDRTSTAATNTRNKARLQEKRGGEERQDEEKDEVRFFLILQQNINMSTIYLIN